MPAPEAPSPSFAAALGVGGRTYPVAEVSPQGVRLRRADIEGALGTEGEAAVHRATLVLHDPHGEAHYPVRLRVTEQGSEKVTLTFVSPSPFLAQALHQFVVDVSYAATAAEDRIATDDPHRARIIDVEPGPLPGSTPTPASFFEEVPLSEVHAANGPAFRPKWHLAPDDDPFARVDVGEPLTAETAADERARVPARALPPSAPPALDPEAEPSFHPELPFQPGPSTAPVPVSTAAAGGGAPPVSHPAVDPPPVSSPALPFHEVRLPALRAAEPASTSEPTAPPARPRRVWLRVWPLAAAALAAFVLLTALIWQRRWVESPRAVLHGSIAVVGAPLSGVLQAIPPRAGAEMAAGSVLFEVVAPQADSLQALQRRGSGVQTVARAHVAGRVIAVHQLPGSPVRAGDPVLTLEEEARRWVLVALTVRQAQRVRPGARAEVTLFGLDEAQAGRVRAVGAGVPEIRAGLLPAGAVPVEVVLDAPVDLPLGTGAEARIRATG